MWKHLILEVKLNKSSLSEKEVKSGMGKLLVFPSQTNVVLTLRPLKRNPLITPAFPMTIQVISTLEMPGNERQQT